MFACRVFVTLTFTAVFTACIATVAAAADPAAITRGQDLFQDQCALCHQVAPGEGGDQGPSLKGVVGRKMASVPGFDYSKGLKAKALVWTKPNLDIFLTDPSAFVSGTRMSVNVGEASDRADLIAFLEASK